MMWFFTYRFILFALLFVTVYSCTRGCFSLDSIQHGVMQSNNSFRRIFFSTLLECAAECLQSQICKSFSFDLETRTCHLNSNNSVDVSVITKDGFVFSNIHSWMKNLSGPCSEVTCSENSSCSVNRLNDASCEQESKGCGHPPIVKNANMEYNGLFVGASVKYTCNKGFKQCHQNTASRCQLDGLWESIPDLCRRSVWHNSSTPLYKAIPCGGTDLLSIIIQGTPLRNTDFDISVIGGVDVLFHIEMRFNNRSLYRTIVTNTRFKNKWGRRKKLNTFPFLVGKEFDLRIDLIGGYYRVTVDGKMISSQREIEAGRKADSIAVRRHVLVHVVEIL